jgi:hypothetical protein
MTSQPSILSRRELLTAAAAVAASLFSKTSALPPAPSEILSATVSHDRIEFLLTGAAKHRLLTFPLYADTTNAAAGTLAWEGELHAETKLSINRIAESADRLFQKFRLFDTAGQPLGSTRFAEDLRQLRSAPPALAWPPGIKGVSCPVDVKDLAELGVKHTHTNLNAAHLVRVDEKERDEAFSRLVDGQRIWFNPGAIRAFDHSIRELTNAKINVVGVILNYFQPGGVLTHPKTDLQRAPNKMGAFNLTNDAGLHHFRGLMEFLSDRYCRGDARYGSVGGWIIGNEVQSTWEWHNMGPATLDQVARQYADELRIAWYSVRNAGADVPIFASFDHFWAMPMTNDATRHRSGRALIDALAALSAREGNFPWHVAQHPYPENLFHPQFWNDKTATFAYDSPRVTFKNVELLAAYLRRKELLCDGKPRRLILSEQGLHAGDTPESEQLQAAAYALAFRRLVQIPGIDAFILHRHVDALHEGGLKLGIWPLTGTGPGKRKRPIWDVVKTIDTPQWQASCNFALPIVGLSDWTQAKPKTGPFPEHT